MSIPIIDSILNLFRKKREEVPIESSNRVAAGQSITLSPDMKTLYLIENNRVRIFDLQSEIGFEIGSVNGRIFVQQAIQDIADPPDDNDPPEEDRPEIPIEPGENMLRAFRRPSKFQLRLPADKYKWNLLYLREKDVLSIIGATDIDFSIIGATDIDFSIIGATDIDFSIIGATDIDFSLTRGTAPPTEAKSAATSSSEKSAEEAKCLIFSYDLTQQPINLKFQDDYLVIVWNRILQS